MHKARKKIMIFVCLAVSFLQAYSIPKAANSQNNTTVSNLTFSGAETADSGAEVLPFSMDAKAEANITTAGTVAGNLSMQANVTLNEGVQKEKITLDLKGVEVTQFFKILSQKSGVTIAASPKVQGRITVLLENLTITEALNTVLRMQNLISEEKKGVIYVMTVPEYEQRRNNLIENMNAGENKAVEAAAANIAAVKKQEEHPALKEEEKISFDLKGVEISELFKMLSLKSGLTIITTPQVQGRVSVFLNNLGFDDALDVVLTLQNLACERIGNVVKIMTAAEYEQLFGKKFSERKKVKTIKLAYAKPANISNVITPLKSDIGKIIVDESSGTIILIDSPPVLALIESTIKELDLPLETAVFDINYANPADIKTYLTDIITPGVGQLIIDQRSNKAIVSDLPERLAKIKKLMSEFDETSRQVLITGEIIQVSLSDKFQRGIDWEHLISDSKLHSLDFAGKFPLSPVPTTNYGKISVGTLESDDYTAILNLMQDYGRVEILSRPQVVAMNKEEARILVGSREPYVSQQQSQSQTGTVTADNIQFIDVGVKLKVVPTINKDGYITMKIKPEISSVREIFETTGGSQVPVVETSETETVVKVKDGAMVMIGGLIKKEHRNSSSGVPIISKIPVLGFFFSNKEKEEKKTELVIFLRPKLISGDSKLAAESQ